MKKFLSLLVSILSISLLTAGNLLHDPSLAANSGTWITNNANAYTVLPGGSPEYGDCVQINLDKDSSIVQKALTLVAGEKYLLGGIVRTSGFSSDPKNYCAFYITDTNWNKGAYTARFPSDTNGKWVKVERVITMPVSKDGNYVFRIFFPGATGKLDIAQVYLRPLSEKAKAGSRPAPHWSGNNLLLNPQLSGNNEELVDWEISKGGKNDFSVYLDRGIPGGRNCSVKLNLAKCIQIRQTGIKLVPGAKYRIGGWVKTKNFSSPDSARTAFYVHNSNWSREVKTAKLPANTNGKWVRLEADVVMPDSPNGTYTFTLWGPKSKGELEFCYPFIIPISAAAVKNSAPAFRGKNLIRNAEFKGTDTDLGIWNNNLGKVENSVKRLPKAGPGGRTGLWINMPKLVNFSQGGLKLVAGERYLIGAWVRTKNFKSTGSQLVVSNWQWTIGVGTGKFPENTNGRWVKFEREVTIQKSRDGSYGFHIYGGKCSGEFEICEPYLIPLTKKAADGSAPAKVWQSDLPMVMPYDPLLRKVSSVTGEIDLCVVYPVDTDYKDYFCRVTHIKDGKERSLKLPISEDGLIHAKFGKLPEGDAKLKVEMIHAKENKVLLSNTYSMTALKPLPETGKRLNNFVVEIYRGKLENRRYKFTAWDDGHYRIAFTQPQKNAIAKLDDMADPVVLFRPNELSETMRFLKRGTHTVTVSGSVPGAEIIISKVPELPVFPFTVDEKNYYDNNEKVKVGAFSCDLDFAKKYLWQNFNTYFMSNIWIPNKNRITAIATEEFKKRGIAVLACEGFPLEKWSNTQAMLDDMKVADSTRTTSGRCLDETGPNAAISVMTALTKLGWALQDYEKIIHTWMDAQYHPYFNYPAIHRPLVAGLTNVSGGRGKLLMETYILSKPDEKSMEDYFAKFIRQIDFLERLVKNPQERMTYIIGNYQKFGIWNANCYPHIDMKYFYDRYMQILATNPKCKGLYGFGCYSIASGDEEMQRWIAKLVRHYCIEGKTELVSKRYGFKLIPGHLDNCDFQDGFKNWTARPAEKGSLVPHKVYGLAKRFQCRRLHNSPYGDTCALFVRSAKAPNKLSRKIKGLVPGKLYTVSWVTADADNVANKRYGKIKSEITFDATLDGATIIPRFSYDMRAGGKQFQDNPVEIQTRKLMFKADKPEVTITFSDWKNDREMGGAAGERRVLNFIQCTPYYAE